MNDTAYSYNALVQSLQVVQSQSTQRPLNLQGDIMVVNNLKPRFSHIVHVYYRFVQFKAVLLIHLSNTLQKLLRLV